MTIYLRGRKWWVDIVVRGVRVREAAGRTKAAALEHERRARAKLELGALGSRAHRITVRQWLGEHLELTADRKRSAERDRSLAAHLLRLLGDRTLAEIDPPTIERYQRVRMSEPRMQPTKRRKRAPVDDAALAGHPRPGTINREVQLLRAALWRAYHAGILPREPVVPLLRESGARDRVISESELRSILAALPAWAAPPIELLYETGMRRGEVLALRWDQVDLAGRLVRLSVADTKTAEARLVPLTDRALEILRAQPRAIDGGTVFRVRGHAIPGPVLFKPWRAACDAARVEGATIHDLRHTRITLWARGGQDVRTIMAAVGHRSVATHLRYSHVRESDLLALVAPPIVAPGVPHDSATGGESRLSEANGEAVSAASVKAKNA